MITGDLESKVDRVWDAFWTGGISNPLEVIEQIPYLLFLKRRDDRQQLALRRARTTGEPLSGNPFPEGVDERGRPYEELRWSVFTVLDPARMGEVVSERALGTCARWAATIPSTRTTCGTPGSPSRRRTCWTGS